LRAFLRDYVDGCSGQLKARRMRKQVYDRTQPTVGEDEVPVNAPKWTTAGYNGSLKASVEKYTRRNVASSSEPLPSTAPSTAPVKAGPSRTADIFYLDESTLVGENVLDSDSSSKEEDQKKKDSNSSEEESDSSSSEESSSGEEEDDKGKDKAEGSSSSSSSSEEEADDRGKGKNVDDKNEENKEAGDRVVEE